jgi:hypothetical protein
LVTPLIFSAIAGNLVAAETSAKYLARPGFGKAHGWRHPNRPQILVGLGVLWVFNSSKISCLLQHGAYNSPLISYKSAIFWQQYRSAILIDLRKQVKKGSIAILYTPSV